MEAWGLSMPAPRLRTAVKSYAAQSPTVPHETTADHWADHWCDESQLESYRALGRHVFCRDDVRSLADLVRRARAAP